MGLRLPSESSGEPRVAKRLYNLASSPYESHRDSAYIDASIIQVRLGVHVQARRRVW